MNQNWPFQLQSFLILGLIYLGVYLRRNRKVHVRVMILAIIWDILLILQIEFSRKAIAKASKIISNPVLMNVHVGLALMTVLFYIVMIVTGRKLLKGKHAIRPYHQKLGYTTVILRTLVLLTSFFTTSAP